MFGGLFRIFLDPSSDASPFPLHDARGQALAETSIMRVAAGVHHMAAMSARGAMWTWGEGAGGKLGHNSTDGLSLCCLVPGISGSCQPTHPVPSPSPAPASAPASLDVHLPTRVDALSNATVMAVAAGANHTVCLTAENRVFSWGEGTNGQLGLGPSTGQVRGVALVVGPSEENEKRA